MKYANWLPIFLLVLTCVYENNHKQICISLYTTKFVFHYTPQHILSPNCVLLSRKHCTLSAVPPTVYAKTITLATCNHVTKSFGSSILINIIMIPSWKRTYTCNSQPTHMSMEDKSSVTKKMVTRQQTVLLKQYSTMMPRWIKRKSRKLFTGLQGMYVCNMTGNKYVPSMNSEMN